MKFLSILAATVCAVVGVANAQTANTTAPRPACVPLNFTASKVGVATLNSGLSIAKGLGLYKKLLGAYDPLAILNNRLDAIPFSILGTDFALTPVIKQLNATGISTLGTRPFNITGDRGLALGLDFNGSIIVDATFAFEIAQLNHQWWQICWTDILNPAKCPPSTIDVVLGVGLVKPTIDLNITLDFLTCPKTAPKGTCTEITASGLLIDAINGKLISTTLPMILHKTVAAGVEGLSVNVESLSKLQFTLPAAGSLLAALGQRILGWTADEVNKKGSLYNDVIKIVNSLGKTLVNQLLSEDLAASFGGDCYTA